jgi:NAD(P)H-dependent flavin oxidoreductase YrpB (nitropropane dioxygenase family)
VTGLHTAICDLFGVRYPIIQTGMGWVSGPRLTAATSAAGGMGILAAVTMTIPEMEDAIRSVKERTDRPFGVNLRPDQPDLEARIAILIRERIKLASFAGPPGKDVTSSSPRAARAAATPATRRPLSCYPRSATP